MKLVILSALIGYVAAECPNACSGHGSCGTFDMCTCHRNWQASDCSERTCPFSNAHVDTPKGDLDHSNSVTSGTVITSSTVYPFGTQEQYPTMTDNDPTPVVQQNSGHYYMECSNKGICDRNTGECECFDGYDGAACQRASCPNDCSGHGTCETISELAFDNFENVYALWDKDTTMGCSCDAGYSGADCSSRTCKAGVDPLYVDDTTARVTTTTVGIHTTGASSLSGTYALKFYDFYGEDYITTPIATEQSFSASCTNVENALKTLPDSVIGNVGCSGSTYATNKGVTYTLTFTENPGYLQQLEIVTNLDGSRPTVTGTGLTTNVYQEGVTGENTDYFATKCSSVIARINYDTSTTTGNVWAASAAPGSLGYIANLDASEEKLLKACLGDSDGNPGNNVEVYNWDYGSMTDFTGVGTGAGHSPAGKDTFIGAHPHAIKTVPVSQSSNYDAGEYHLVWYDSTETNKFRVANLPAPDGSGNSFGVSSYIHTTDGTVEQLARDANSDSVVTSDKNETRVVGYFEQFTNKIYTNIDASCEGAGSLTACLEKGDRLFVVDGCWGDGAGSVPYFPGAATFFGDNVLTCATAADADKSTGNLYTINKIYTQPFSANTTQWYHGYSRETKGYEDRFVIEVDYNIGWAGDSLGDPDNSGGRNTGIVILFKFSPATTGNYEYVASCSNRGACDGETGLCSCFKGYTGDDCSTQNSLAI